MSESRRPSDDDLRAALEPRLGPIRSMTRAPYRYATSFPLEELVVTLDAGERRLIFKDLCWERLHPDAARTKPSLLHEPRRVIEIQRAVLDPLGVGPACAAAIADEAGDRFWLITDKVDGVELWQVGEIDVWASVAAWLARFHDLHRGATERVRVSCPHLRHIDAPTVRFWADRATSALLVLGDGPAGELLDRLAAAPAVLEPLAAAETTVIHGELYPSNVLVGSASPDVWPVDWELAAIGPPAIDLAALVTGWAAAERDLLVAAYQAVSDSDVAALLPVARLHLALQWIGWSDRWQPPIEHARDWIADALMALDEIGA